MIGKTLGHYTIIEQIGAGGMGVVYRVRDMRLEREVALKVLRPEKFADPAERRRFKREAQALSKVNHPHIAAVYDFDSDGGVDFIVMEIVAGQPLSSMLASVGQFSESQTVQIGVQIASALEEAHEAGIIHGDLKPGNIVVSGKGRAKVLDFGLAQISKLRADMESTVLESFEMAFRGTLPYMAPELLLGGNVDYRIDLYALGIVLYEMLTGQRPFTDESRWRLATAIVHAAATSPRKWNNQISEKIERIILKAIDKDPDRRYQSAKEMIADLKHSSRSDESSSAARGHARRVGAGAPIVESIVALPARVFGSEADQFFADAIPSTLSTYLSQISQLETKIPPTSLDVKKLKWDLRKIAAAYGVSTVVVSSATCTSGQVSLHVQLVEVGSRRMLWSGEFEGKQANCIQLVRAAAEQIHHYLRPDKVLSFRNSQAVADSGVELLLQRAQYYFRLYSNRANQVDFENALSAFVKAFELAPATSEIPAAIARLYCLKEQAGASYSEILPDADHWARRALELDPRSSTAWAVLSQLEHARPENNHRHRVDCALKAAFFGPNNSFAHTEVGNVLAPASYSLGIEAWHQAYKLDPLDLSLPTVAAILQSTLGRYSNALETLNPLLKAEPDFPFGVLSRVFARIVALRPDEAEDDFRKLEPMVKLGRLRPEWVEFAGTCIAFEQAINKGDEALATPFMEKLVTVARGEKPFPRWENITEGVAPILAGCGKTEAALELLNFRKDSGCVCPYDVLILNPSLEPVRQDPRFIKIATRSRAQFEGMVLMLELAQARGEFPPYLQQPLEEILNRTGLSKRTGGSFHE